MGTAREVLSWHQHAVFSYGCSTQIMNDLVKVLDGHDNGPRSLLGCMESDTFIVNPNGPHRLGQGL